MGVLIGQRPHHLLFPNAVINYTFLLALPCAFVFLLPLLCVSKEYYYMFTMQTNVSCTWLALVIYHICLSPVGM